jgi:hypothetical protein
VRGLVFFLEDLVIPLLGRAERSGVLVEARGAVVRDLSRFRDGDVARFEARDLGLAGRQTC